MPSLRAASIDAEGYARWRRLAGRATVHSVFERVVNLQSAGGELFVMAAAGVDDAPATVVADGPLDVAGLAPGDQVVADGNAIVVTGRVELALAGARAWRAVLPAYPTQDARLRRNLALVREALARRWAHGASVSALGRELDQLLAHRRDLLCSALAAGDREAACRHGRAMLGLGHGLTPSGDDFLAGLMVVLHLPGGPGVALCDVGPQIVDGAERRTNAISVAMLRAAREGRVRDCVIVLLRELVAGDPNALDETLARVLAIGSTSGGDMAAGIVAGFDVQLQLANVPAEPAACAA
ncbi:MAG TPA: DUF2877 domain-containing protein [Ramlibacter sp.]